MHVKWPKLEFILPLSFPVLPLPLENDGNRKLIFSDTNIPQDGGGWG